MQSCSLEVMYKCQFCILIIPVFVLQGVSVETICNTIRRLPVLKTLSNDQHVYVVCNLHKVRHNAVDILLVSFSHRF